jgi:trk system potassium uptake protein TrkA
MLLEQNHTVRLVEARKEILARVHRELPTEVIYEGDPTDMDVLERAGIRKVDVLAACLANDEENLVVCYVGRKHFHVPRTIARINNPRNAWLFDERFHVDVALNQSAVMASFIEQEMARSEKGEIMTLLKLYRGDYSLVEEIVPEGAVIIGQPLKDLGLADNCVIAAIVRDEQVLMPRGTSVFQAGDEILAITNSEGAGKFKELFGSPTVPG